ncbi:hypothetical protein DICPUDRAFT_74298 [Dictyostelium purpureum]|uniref:Fe2OG dioxygenase domain-containing protein n=1 Tax=Dictyostelium purpureum TaxID=5786 RepID=F0Z7B8_DICPU|nr:uncharacterized protein DICPUDRAFT_74298 [Dictyostelium purpureum]EGC40113.1 hypothetical protein DICPUDRAFT_74298 [Dictyostelium purpureum]|eukprot:XP_003283303.1 hypothetical protein DICPUDRAFT_74298 [Dictyostelium purpureum]
MNNNNIKNNKNINYSIPIVDFSNLGTNQGKIKISKEINDACRASGFFYIVNHGIEQSVLDELLEYTQKFFSLPYDVKMKWRVGGVSRGLYGYFGIGKQVIVGKDYKEGYYLDIEKECDGHSLYPTKDEEEMYGLVGFKNFIEKYIAIVLKLSDTVFELIAQSLNLPIDYFKNKYTFDPATFLSLLKYPSNAKIEGDDQLEDEKKFGIGRHTDWPLLTFLTQSQIEGLQVLVGDTFIDAPPIKGSFVCNVGDLFEIITRGYFVSSFHRAIYNKSTNDRYSFPLFVGSELDVPLEVIDGFNMFPLKKNPNRPHDQCDQFYSFRGSYRQYYEYRLKNTFNDYLNKD